MNHYRFRHYLAALSTGIILIDLFYNLFLNIKEALIPSITPLPNDGLPISPEFAFSWIQVAINGTIILILSWAILVCLYINHQGLNYRILKAQIKYYVAYCMILAFTLPSLWQWYHTIYQLIQGHNTISLINPRYLLIAICQPFLILLPYNAYISQWHAKRHKIQAQTSTTDKI